MLFSVVTVIRESEELVMVICWSLGLEAIE